MWPLIHYKNITVFFLRNFLLYFQEKPYVKHTSAFFASFYIQSENRRKRLSYLFRKTDGVENGIKTLYFKDIFQRLPP